MIKTLEQLENEYWDPPEFESHLTMTCHRLRQKPIDTFTVEDLRIMIGQNIGVTYLLPRALGVLRADPVARGDFYEGDLLNSVIHSDLIRGSEDKELLFELAQMCHVAIELECSAASDTYLADYTAEDLGLTPEIAKQLRQDAISNVLATQPLVDFKAFYEEHG
ncbi:MAG: contact-dependent growth inhibition system immunity protein [Stappiaceae bacterium]